MILLVLASIIGALLYDNIYYFLMAFVSFLTLSLIKKNKIFLLALIVLVFQFLNCNYRFKLDNHILGKFKVVYDYDNSDKYIIRNGIKKYLIYFDKKLNEGDILYISGTPKKLLEKMNPSDFNYENYLKSKGVVSLINLDNLKVVKSGFSARYSFLNYVKSSFDKYLNESSSKFLKSVVLADSSYMEDDILNNYREIGIGHVLALSGLHIGLLMLIINTSFKALRFPKLFIRGSSSILIFIYLYLIDFPIGGVRAFIMFTILNFSYLFKYKYDRNFALILSGLIILLISPFSFYSPSFTLSYLSVVGIFIFYKNLNSVFGNGFLQNCIALSLSVLIMILPLNSYYFNSISIITIISNILVLPFLTISIILGYIALIFKFLAVFIGPTIDLSIDIANYLIENLIDKFKFLNLTGNIGISGVFIYYLAIIIYVFKDNFKNKKFNFCVLTLIFSLFLTNIYSFFIYENTFRIDFLYIDQGDCAIIRSKGKVYLVDTGGSHLQNYRPASKYLVPYIKSLGIRQINGIFISHFDEDHVDGILDIIDKVKINNVFISYVEDNKYLNIAKSKGINIYKLNNKDVLKLDSDTTVNVLSNPNKYNSPNDNSLVFILNHKGFKTLFTGDLEKEEINIKNKVNLLKVAHHGSNTSTSMEFLKNTKPNFAIISAGVNNLYNHPRQEVLERLKSMGVKVKITKINGCITLEIYDGKIKFSGYRDKRNYNIEYVILMLILLFLFVKRNEKYFELQGTL